MTTRTGFGRATEGAQRPPERRAVLRFAGGASLAALIAACSRPPGPSGGAAPLNAAEPPTFTGPVEDVHLRMSARASFAEIAPGIDTPVLSFDAEVLEGDPRTVAATTSYLGPTLHLREGQRVRVTFHNALEQESIVHWHGLIVPEDQDGQPHYAVGPGETYEYDFTIQNRPGTFWYHPHPHHHTAEQVYRGLAGLLIVHGSEPDLPAGEHDIALVLQDRSIGFDGQLRYVQSRRDVMAGFVGETLVTNGTVDHEVAVERAPHRVRILNGANARTQHLRLSNGDDLVVVATDGCLLPEAHTVSGLILTPGQRADIWLDLARFAPGDRVELLSAEVFVSSMGGMGDTGPGGGMSGGMSGGMNGGMNGGMDGGMDGELRLDHRVAATFLVTDSPARPGTAPSTLGGRIDIDASAAVNVGAPKEFVLSTRRGSHWINDRQWEGQIASELETAAFGTIELWDFVNRSPMIHPMHLHGEAFRIVERSWDDASSRSAWDTIASDVIDTGLNDTVLVWPGQRVRIAVRFDKHRGYFPYHCHILEHEDDGMMRNFRVV